MNPEVTTYIDTLSQEWQIALCQQLRQAVHTAAPDTAERLQYKKPHFLKNGKYLAVISPAKSGVSFTLFNANGIENALFEPSDVSDRKTIKFKPDQVVDIDLLVGLITEAAKTL